MPAVQIGSVQISNSVAAGASVWWYDVPRGRWLAAAQLEGGGPAAAVAWAPAGGRPSELVATARGDTVSLWHLSGAIDEMKVADAAPLAAFRDLPC